jgi:hypothetical protein
VGRGSVMVCICAEMMYRGAGIDVAPTRVSGVRAHRGWGVLSRCEEHA